MKKLDCFIFSPVSLPWTKRGIRSISSAINVASHLETLVSTSVMASHSVEMTTLLRLLPNVAAVSSLSWIIILLPLVSTGTRSVSSAM